MELEILLKAISPLKIEGDTHKNITGINTDSRLVETGDVFIAVKGTQTDGHNYIGKAIERGLVRLCVNNGLKHGLNMWRMYKYKTQKRR